MTTAVLDRRRSEPQLNTRDVEWAAIIDAYNQVTEKLKASHETLTQEVRRLQRQLAEKDEELQRRKRLAALGEMAAGVAHEVRNPLGGILLYATMLERDLPAPSNESNIARQIASAARMLESVVGDVLAFANPQPPNCRPTRMDTLAAEVIELLRPRWAKNRCTVSLRCEREAITACVEATQVQRALLNVISNAIDAAGDDGEVWVTLRDASADERFVNVEVADNGPGVSEELVERIFNPFFTTKDSGTGLGLAIVHGIVEAHGGQVSVSRRDGGGAVFTLLLPREGMKD